MTHELRTLPSRVLAKRPSRELAGTREGWWRTFIEPDCLHMAHNAYPRPIRHPFVCVEGPDGEEEWGVGAVFPEGTVLRVDRRPKMAIAVRMWLESPTKPQIVKSLGEFGVREQTDNGEDGTT